MSPSLLSSFLGHVVARTWDAGFKASTGCAQGRQHLPQSSCESPGTEPLAEEQSRRKRIKIEAHYKKPPLLNQDLGTWKAEMTKSPQVTSIKCGPGYFLGGFSFWQPSAKASLDSSSRDTGRWDGPSRPRLDFVHPT